MQGRNESRNGKKQAGSAFDHIGEANKLARDYKKEVAASCHVKNSHFFCRGRIAQKHNLLCQIMVLNARVAQQDNLIAGFADGGGEAQTVGARLVGEAFAAILRDQHRARQTGQHDAAIIQLGAAGDRLVGAGIDLLPAAACIG